MAPKYSIDLKKTQRNRTKKIKEKNLSRINTSLIPKNKTNIRLMEITKKKSRTLI